MNPELEKIVHIEIPGNPYWEVFKRFGRDELIALLINVSGTAAMDFMFDNRMLESIAGPVSRRARDVATSTIGPVIEKAGFFPGHFHEAWQEYKKAPEKEREAFNEYAKKALKGGVKSLAQDVLVHDPLYVAMMYGGLSIYPETPAAILATSSFLAAVAAVAVGEVTYNELKFKNHKRKLHKLRFEDERYYESRFLIDKRVCPDRFMEKMQERFNLGNILVGEYNDLYFNDTLPHINGRIPKIRLRERDGDNGSVWKTAQIIYKRTSEIAQKNPEQFRYFPQLKEKNYLLLDQDMPKNINGIEDEKVQKFLKKYAGENVCDIRFQRTVAFNPESLLVATDKVGHDGNRPFYVAELKVYDDIPLLKKAMHYVMKEFPLVQTTHGKLELSCLCGNGYS